jgi:phospholipid transport system substrate-binding protein
LDGRIRVSRQVSQLSAIRPILVFGLICIALLCSSGRGVHAADTLPDDMVKAGMAKLADAALAHGNHSESSEKDLADAIRLFLTEYTDIHYAARLIFATYWETATPAQRDRFAETFNNQVAHLLVKFVPGIDYGSVRVDPYLGDTEETPLMIRTTFRTSDKETINFVLVVHEREGRWLIFDVVAEGVSYVKTYRNQFTGEISDIGLEATIERFEIRSARRGND